MLDWLTELVAGNLPWVTLVSIILVPLFVLLAIRLSIGHKRKEEAQSAPKPAEAAPPTTQTGGAPKPASAQPPPSIPKPSPTPAPGPTTAPSSAPAPTPSPKPHEMAKPSASKPEAEIHFPGQVPLDHMATEEFDFHELAEKPYVTVTVHFGTDRLDYGPGAEPNNRFGEKRAAPEPGQSPVTYGTCDVAIPKSHKVGELEEPGWFETERPDRHVMLLSLDTQTHDAFFASLKERFAGKRQCFLFVHGFNVSFKNAARRTAQIAYDLRFDGIPIFYSWPTAVVGETSFSPTAYTEAENNAIWARYHFADFLHDVIRRAAPEVLHIVAHSMGNRIVADALVDIGPRLTPEERAVLSEIVLTAPDIDADTFKTQIAPRLSAVVPRISLYASDKDQALNLSKTVHQLPRIGETRAAIPMPVPGIEVIDATEAKTDYFGHNYYGDAEAIIADILVATRARRSARERTLTLRSEASTHWRVRTEATINEAWSSLAGV